MGEIDECLAHHAVESNNVGVFQLFPDDVAVVVLDQENLGGGSFGRGCRVGEERKRGKK